MILTDLRISREGWEAGTGWELKPEGACKGDVCVPLDAGGAADEVDAGVLAERLDMPLVHDPEHGIWSLGPAAVTGRALTTATAPELELPDLEGSMFSLASLRGKKVLLVAWASW